MQVRYHRKRRECFVFFINTTNVENRLPLVDEHWDAVCQASLHRRRGSGVGDLVLQVCGE